MISDYKYSLDFRDPYLLLLVLNGGVCSHGGICSQLEVSSFHSDSGFGISQILFLFYPNSARLASLFGLDQATAGHGNEFFQYTAPKQPKKGHGTASTGKLRGIRLSNLP
jgi:hypothetical protein